MTEFTAKKIAAGIYEYRGYKIERRHETPATYYGSWTFYGKGTPFDGTATSSLTFAKEGVDRLIERLAAKEAS